MRFHNAVSNAVDDINIQSTLTLQATLDEAELKKFGNADNLWSSSLGHEFGESPHL